VVPLPLSTTVSCPLTFWQSLTAKTGRDDETKPSVNVANAIVAKILFLKHIIFLLGLKLAIFSPRGAFTLVNAGIRLESGKLFSGS
jgi:hypothetical protein